MMSEEERERFLRVLRSCNWETLLSADTLLCVLCVNTLITAILNITPYRSPRLLSLPEEKLSNSLPRPSKLPALHPDGLD